MNLAEKINTFIITRLERNQEREKSISNLEYLKNVVYKFLTFTTIEEKSQLLPVLCTMLKLTQEEQKTIMTVASKNVKRKRKRRYRK
jgi:GRIP and coiled-coil domain-containing protein 2